MTEGEAYLRKGDTDLVAKLNQAIKDIRANGTYQKIGIGGEAAQILVRHHLAPMDDHEAVAEVRDLLEDTDSPAR